MMPLNESKPLTPLKSIHKYCVECMGDNTHLVAKCDKEECPLWSYRMGHNPYHKGMGSKKKDPETGKFMKTAKKLTADEIVLNGDYKLVRIKPNAQGGTNEESPDTSPKTRQN